MKTFFRGFGKGMKEFGQTISTVINTILLLPVYFVGVGFTSIFARILKKRFLETKMSKDSYWSELNLKKKEMKEYYRQF
tara:strand:- start:62 stop:298 length:237 start_codon:yes stop_codon:yes gene_type:complete